MGTSTVAGSHERSGDGVSPEALRGGKITPEPSEEKLADREPGRTDRTLN